jgi:serine protease Do
VDENKGIEPDIIDEDLYEEFEEEELYELVQQAKHDAFLKAKLEKQEKPRRPFPKWMFWLIAIAMVINVIAILPYTFSIPAIDFLITSSKLSLQNDIKTYKEAVVVIETGESKGTGFAFSSDGYILTNYHVVENGGQITVAFPKDGLFTATIEAVFPEIDLALLKVQSEEDLPFLNLATSPSYDEQVHITFIGNPLAFNGIANEGTIIGDTDLEDWQKPVIMIEAPVYHGNSGSPVLNDKGDVIGVIFATLDHEELGKVGLFIPIDYFLEQNVK